MTKSGNGAGAEPRQRLGALRILSEMIGALRFGVQADPRNAKDFFGLARRADESGIDALFVPDHPASCVSPFVALASAAAVTSRIRLGTYVLNAGIHHPVQIANDLNTLDLLSEGRAILGVGAGHTPAEWTHRGMPYPAAPPRVDRMISFTNHVRGLSRGDVVDEGDDFFTLGNAVIAHPAACQAPIPLLVGGNGRRVLRFAGEHSDVVSVSGLGATKADGHSHTPKWSHAEIDESSAHIRTGAAGRPLPIVEALVQRLKITNDRRAVLDSFARRAEIDVALLDDNPFVLVGSAPHIADQIDAHRDRWGFTSFVARADSLDDLLEIAARRK